MDTKARGLSRRDFMKGAVATTAGLTILGATARGQARVLKAGVIGPGGRGSGATRNFLEAGRFTNTNVEVTAVADAYADRAAGVARMCNIPRNRVFVGFEGYKQLLDTDVDIVLMATPPNFRPVHFEAAIRAGKHVFFEKPVAVDPPGARKVMEAGRLAAQRRLCVVAGTQRRHQKGYMATARLVRDQNVIGSIRGGRVAWCGGRLWFRRRQANWSNREYLVRNWVSFAEMSGDHIVEQHVHNLDVSNWFLGSHPVAALGFGGRARRQTGDQFDFFSVDLEYPGGVHIHSCCRQVNGCQGGVNEHFVGQTGTTNAHGGISRNGERVRVDASQIPGHNNAYVNEHVALLQGILDPQNKYINEAQNVAEATLAAIIGRMSAYTGRRIAWDEALNPTHRWGSYTCQPTAAHFEQGEVPVPREEPAVPGSP